MLFRARQFHGLADGAHSDATGITHAIAAGADEVVGKAVLLGIHWGQG